MRVKVATKDTLEKKWVGQDVLKFRNKRVNLFSSAHLTCFHVT